MKTFSTRTRGAATLLVGAAAAAIMSSPVQPAAADEVGGQSHKRYLLNNTYHGVWQDDGVKGQVKNFTNRRIVVRDATMDSVAAMVGVVTQDAHLFHASIRSNLLYAKPDSTGQEIEEALQHFGTVDLGAARA